MLKRIIMCVIGAMMIVSLAACTPTTEKNATGQTKAQTQAPKNGVSDKQPDPTAPELDVISIYRIEEGGTTLVGTMDAVEERTPQVLVDLLIKYGMLEEGTKAISFEAKEKLESEEVGPGVPKIPGMVIENTLSDSAVLNLSGFPEADPQKDMKLQAVANTFLENMNVLNLTIQVNGSTIGDNYTYMEPMK